MYGTARIAKRWMLVREQEGGSLLTVLTGDNEHTIGQVLKAIAEPHPDPDATKDYEKLQVGAKFWLVRRGAGATYDVGVAVAHSEDELDAVLRLVRHAPPRGI